MNLKTPSPENMNALCRRYWKHVLILAFCLPIIALERLYYIDFESRDYKFFLNGWVEHIRLHGLDEAYRYGFSNYTPFYTYLLGVFNILFPSLENLYAVKAVSFIGEGLAAIIVYRIASILYPSPSLRPMITALLLLLSPSVVVNSASAAQCDIWYTLFLLASVYALIKRRPVWVWIAFGFAISFKLQAIFLAPFLLLCLFRRLLSWRHIWIPVAIYMLLCLPCYFEGRPWIELMTVYWQQFNWDRRIGIAANFYPYIRMPYEQLRNVGIAVTIIVALIYACIGARYWKSKPAVIDTLLLATLCVALMPFLLPKMFDRYFFVADVFSIVLACMRPRWFILPLLFQLSSILAYPNYQFETAYELTGWNRLERHPIATWLNVAAIGLLFWMCYSTIRQKLRYKVPTN